MVTFSDYKVEIHSTTDSNHLIKQSQLKKLKKNHAEINLK